MMWKERMEDEIDKLTNWQRRVLLFWVVREIVYLGCSITDHDFERLLQQAKTQ